eukprot:gene12835-12963_t
MLHLYQQHGALNTVILCMGMGLYKPGCRQVRARLLLLPVAAQCLSAARLSCVPGIVTRDVITRFGSTMLLAAVCSCAVELRSRRAFLLHTTELQT